MGYAFTYPIFKLLGGCKVVAYVHYPTISKDMLNLVFERRPTYNNDANIASNSAKTRAKFIYYTLFAKLYGWMGSFASLVMVNSQWTQDHINEIWKIPQRTSVVFPPCNVSDYKSLALSPRTQTIVSLGQFRYLILFLINHMIALKKTILFNFDLLQNF
jgi:alpha-1,2-mannosyltransferase